MTALARRLRTVGIGVALAAAGVALASDHSDFTANPKADLTDVHAFVVGARGPIARGREGDLVIAVSTNPAVPVTATDYVFPTNVTFEIHVDNDALVWDDPTSVLDDGFLGGTIAWPSLISEDITFRIRFGADNSPVVERIVDGRVDEIQAHPQVQLFAGLRDEPFIRTARIGRNVGSIVLQLPLAWVLRRQSTLLLWVTAKIDGSAELHDESYGRPSGGRGLNRLHPSEHLGATGLPPNVLIYDTSRPAAFPNGRALTDDVIDLVCLLDTDGDGIQEQAGSCANYVGDVPPATENDGGFLEVFPYLGAPH